nr:hypothetical protein [Chloroflexota bacterium]
LVVPPAEALRLGADAGVLGTVVWRVDAGHGLYEAVEEWTEEAARWLAEVLRGEGVRPSTPVDPTAANRETRETATVLETTM